MPRKAEYWRNPEKARKDRLDYHKRVKDSKKYKNKQRSYYLENKELFRASNMNRRKMAKVSVFEHYGNLCACCGEVEFKFLTIDHINGGGGKHRKEVGRDFYLWVVRNNFPKDLQLLCMNCNFGKRMNNNICPHKTKN